MENIDKAGKRINCLENKFRPTVRVTMPVSSLGYDVHLQNLWP